MIGAARTIFEGSAFEGLLEGICAGVPALAARDVEDEFLDMPLEDRFLEREVSIAWIWDSESVHLVQICQYGWHIA